MKPANNTKFFAKLSVAALLAIGAFTTHAQTWTTVCDQFGSCGDIGTTAAGEVFAVGYRFTDAGGSEAIVRGSSDQGATWLLLDHYSETNLSYTHNRAFAADPNTGHLFAGGNLNNYLPNGTAQYDALWFIREWNPETQAWSTADDYWKLASDVGQASCADILVTTNGVYATGGGALGTGLGWVTRKRAAGADAFTTVDADYSGQTEGAAWDLGYHPYYGVFAVGALKGIWSVRQSSTGDRNTWGTVDTFYSPREWIGGRALCILATPAKIHVVGSAYKYRQGNHWIVRSSSDGGQTWAITDDYAPTAGTEARGIVQDASTNLWVCGAVPGSAGGTQWLVRKGTIGTKLVKQGKTWVPVETITWTNVGDPYQLDPGKTALPSGITIDPSGNAFVGGYAVDALDRVHWIVRRLAAQ